MRNSLKSLLGLAFILMAIGFSSCFDILEEYEFNADGSGKAKFEMDVSKMMAFIEGMGSVLDSTSEDSEGGADMSESMKEMYENMEAIQTLKLIPGISNVVNLSNPEEKVIGYSFEFKDIKALNMALSLRGSDMGMGGALGMGGDDEDVASENENSIAFSGKKFKRVQEMNMPKVDEEDEDKQQGMEMAKMMFQGANYTARYTFPRNVKKVKGNDAAVIGADGKTVTIENTLGDLLEGKSTMGADIRLK